MQSAGRGPRSHTVRRFATLIPRVRATMNVRLMHGGLVVAISFACSTCGAPRVVGPSGVRRSSSAIFALLDAPPRRERRDPEPRQAAVTPPAFDLDRELETAGLSTGRAEELADPSPEMGRASGPGTLRVVRISSSPRRARVFLGDRRLGVTPIVVRTPPEEIWILRISREGFHPGWVTLPADRSRVHVGLDPLPPPPPRREWPPECMTMPCVRRPLL
jgi:hypothetical protein